MTSAFGTAVPSFRATKLSDKTISRRRRRGERERRLQAAVAEVLEPRVLMTATHLAFVVQPTTTTAGQSISSISVDVEDSGNAIVTSDTSLVVFSINTGPAGTEGTLFVAVHAVAGVATLSGLSLTTAGDYTLAASDGSLTGDVSSSFTINPDAATQLVITSEPSNTTADNDLGTLTAKVEDEFGNVETGDSSNVTVGINTGGGSLGGTTTVAASDGVATFSNLAITQPGNYTLAVSDGELAGATTDGFTVSHGAASKLVITSQPSGTVAGQTISSVSVQVEDQFGNLISGDNSAVTLSLASGSGSLGGTLTEDAVNGVATFSDLNLTKAGSFKLGATDGLLAAATSNSFAISAATATHLVVTTQPTNVSAGSLGTINVSVEDQYNNVVTTDSSNVTVALNGNASLGGTKTVAASSGVAGFTDLSVTTSGSYSLSFTDGGLTAATSNSFTVSAGMATQLAITTQPASTTAGQTFSNVVVAVEDQYNNIVTTDSSNVTIAIASGGGTLNGTKTVAASNGVATFSTLSINQAGNDSLYVTDGVLTAATSNSFSIAAAAAGKLVFTTQPSGTTAGTGLSSVVVKVEDAFNNVITTDSSNVTLAVSSGNGTLLGTTTVAAVNGVATFGNLTLDQADNFTLGANDGSLAAATSSSFTITPAAATHLAFISQPSSIVAGDELTGVSVAAEDQYGNIKTSSNGNVTFTVSGGGSNLNFVITPSSGVATLSDLDLVKAGNYTIHAAATGLTAANANTITVTPDVASQLVITTQPTTTVAGQTISSTVVKVEDQFNNIVTTDSSNVTIALNSGATLGGTKTVAAVNGVATFGDLSINTAGSYTASLTDGVLAGATSSSFTISPAAASQLVFTTEPSTTTAGQTISNIVVKVEDQFNNVITTDSSNVTLALNSGATLSGTKTVAASSGVATFSGLSMNTAGSYTVSATDGLLTGATSSGFTISAASADHLAFTTQPSSGAAGALGNITVAVEDQYNNIVTSDSSSVAMSFASGSGTLLGTTTEAASNGVATFTDLAIHTPNSFKLEADDGLLNSATSNSFTITPASATHLVITTQPTDTVAGQTISSTVVKVEDQYNNVVTTDSSNVTLALTSGNATITGTKTVAASSGVATFSGLSMTAAGSYGFTLTDGLLTSAASNSITISPASADHLAFTTQPTTTVAGQTISTLAVSVEDQYNNVISSDSSNVTLTLNSGQTLSGTKTQAASSGVASFADLSMNTAGNYTVSATDGLLAGATSSSFTISPASASQLVITTQPTTTVAGQTISSTVVKVEDQFNNIVTTDSSNVTIALNSGATLGGTKTVAAVNGVATFGDLSINTAGSYTASLTDGVLAGATSSSFTISPAAASQLVFTTEPSTTTAGQTISNIVVKVEDQFNNVITTDSSNVTLALNSGATLSGTKTVAASSGVATFSGLSMNTAGSYTVSATDGLLTGATSSGFTISAASADHLAFTTQPSSGAAGALGNITVAVEDQYNNIVTSDSSSVAMSFASGSGTLLGTTTEAASNGVATFTDLAIHTPNSFKLEADDGLLNSATSNSFTITPASATHLVITTQPTDTVAGQTISSTVVKVEDQYNNVVTTDSSNVTLALTSGNATITGTKTVAASSGVATFSGLSMTAAGSYGFTLTDGLLTSAASNSITISPASADHLAFTTQPTTTVAGQTISTLAVSVEDQYNNVISSDSSNVTLTLNSGQTLSGTKTQAASSGVASFADLSMNTAGNYTVSATDGLLAGATSSSFTISPASASQLVITTQPTTTVAGQTISSTVVKVEDQFNNIVTTDSSNVTIALNSGATLGGTKTVAAVNGVATFGDLSINTAGSYTASLTDGVLAGATSSSFTISPAAATQLVFTTQPTDAVAGNLLSTVVVKVEDQYSNVVTTDSSNVSLSVNTGGSTITLIVAASSGVASFSGFSIDQAGTYHLHATDGLLTASNSSDFTITPAAASQLVITTQPGSTSAGAPITVIAAVEDQYNNIVTTDSSNVTIALASGSGVLNGTATVAAENGVATFSGLSITTPGTYSVAVTDGSLAGATSNSFTLTPAVATQLVITTEPTTTVAGQTISNVVVKVEDQYNNILTGNSSSITLTLDGNGTLGGTKTVAAVNGVATFSTLAIDQAGAYSVSATDGVLTGATSNSFTITPASATHLVITTQPTDTVAGQTISSTVVKVEDQYNNVVTTDSSNVTIALNTDEVLSGTKTVAASSGVATFSTLSMTKTGNYSLDATDGLLTGASSSAFTITPAAANHLAFTTQPSSGTVGAFGNITVAVEDQYNNIVTTDSSAVTMSIASGNGTLLGNASGSAVNGVATFGGLAIHTPDTFTLGAADGNLTVATSGNFTLTPGAATHLVITTQPTSTVAGVTISNVVVKVEDQYNNVVTSDSSNITLALNGNASLGGTKTVAASSGVGTFSTLSITKTGNYSLDVTDGLLTAATSSSFAITPAAADHLAFTTQPASGAAGNMANVVVSVEDAFNNVVTGDSSSVTIALAGGNGTLGGTKTVAASSGVATFSTLSLTTAGNHTLAATDGIIDAATSNAFTTSAAAAAKLVFSSEPSTTTSKNISSLIVDVEDTFGNIVTTDDSNVTIGTASGPSGTTISGTKTAAASSGVATFSGLALSKTGNFALSATDGVLAAATSSTFTTGAKLVFQHQPANTVAGVTMNPVTVLVEDSSGHVLTGDDSSVTLAIETGPTGATMSGTTTVSAVAGVASFSDLSLVQAGSYKVTASDGLLTAVNSNSFSLTAAAPAHIAFLQNASNVVAGVKMAPAVKFELTDSFGNVAVNNHSTITISIASGPEGGALSGTFTATPSNGIVTFSNLVLDKAGNYTLHASGAGLSIDATPITVSPAAAKKLAFSQEPTSVTAGTAISPAITVSVEDSFGNLVASSSANITLAKNGGPSGSTLTPVTLAAVDGIATFNAVVLNTSGNYTLKATAPSLSQVVSSTFAVTPSVSIQR